MTVRYNVCPNNTRVVSTISRQPLLHLSPLLPPIPLLVIVVVVVVVVVVVSSDSMAILLEVFV